MDEEKKILSDKELEEVNGGTQTIEVLDFAPLTDNCLYQTNNIVTKPIDNQLASFPLD